MMPNPEAVAVYTLGAGGTPNYKADGYLYICAFPLTHMARPLYARRDKALADELEAIPYTLRQPTIIWLTNAQNIGHALDGFALLCQFSYGRAALPCWHCTFRQREIRSGATPEK